MANVYIINNWEVPHDEWQSFVRILNQIDPKKARAITADNGVDDFEMTDILDRDGNLRINHADFKDIKNPLFGQVLAILRKYDFFRENDLDKSMSDEEYKKVPEQFWTDKDFVLSATSESRHYCSAAFRHANLYKNLPFAGEAIERAAKNDPSSALEYAARYKDAPYAK